MHVWFMHETGVPHVPPEVHVSTAFPAVHRVDETSHPESLPPSGLPSTPLLDPESVPPPEPESTPLLDPVSTPLLEPASLPLLDAEPLLDPDPLLEADPELLPVPPSSVAS
ncbi:MAG TPA: hypothetical protein VGG39_16710 [Polyangiaceae bacterium]|jgi:hypothetical protein